MRIAGSHLFLIAVSCAGCANLVEVEGAGTSGASTSSSGVITVGDAVSSVASSGGAPSQAAGGSPSTVTDSSTTDSSTTTDSRTGTLVLAGSGGAGGGFVEEQDAFFVVSQNTATVTVANLAVLPKNHWLDCSETKVGECFYRACGANLPLPSEGGVQAYGGPALVSGASEPVSVHWVNSSDGYAYFYEDQQPVFVGGESLVFSLAGAASVPALTTSLTATTRVMVEPFGGEIDRTADLQVSWTGGAPADTVDLCFLGNLNDSSGPPLLCCDVPATSGELTVPSTLLSLFPAHSEHTVLMRTLNESTVDAGGWTLHAAAQSFALYSNSTTTVDGSLFFD